VPGRRRQPKKTRINAKRTLIAEADALLLASSLILDSPHRWARRAYALDARGTSVAVDAPHAARFCLSGALLRAEHDLHRTPMPLRTDDAPDVDDLLEPLLPEGAAPRLHLALQALALASGWELQKLGIRFRLFPADSQEQIPTLLHRPLLLGLHPRSRFRHCDHALATALSILHWIAKDDERVDQAIRDQEPGR
jgi:hypothetical protein